MFRPGWLEALKREAEQRPAEALVPASFVEFCRETIGVEMTIGQRVIARVAYDGVNPCDLPSASERKLALKIFGDVDEIDSRAKHVVVAVCGRGAGKSYILAALRALHLAMTVSFPRLAPGEIAAAIIVAPDLRLARKTLSFVSGAVESSMLRSMVRAQSVDRIELERPDGVRVAVECLPASAKGSALRGRTTACAVLDEAAFFRDAETGAVNDLEVYRALQPRVVAGGQTVIISTPWTRLGLLHELFEANFGHPDTALAAHAPTLLLQDTEETRELVAREEKRDPVNARREFHAEFMDVDASTFFDPRAIRACIDETIELPIEWASVRPEEHVVSVGADFAFRRDSSALVAVLRDPDDVYRVAAIEERTPDTRPLKPSEIVQGFGVLAKSYGADVVVADEHYREAVYEHLQDAGIAMIPAPIGANGKADTYVLARALMLEGRVRIPNHERLLRQLREVTSRPLAGGGVSIDSPRWKTGGHGDLVSAFVLALWWAERNHKPDRTVVLSPEQRLAAKEDERLDRILEVNREREMEEDEQWQ